MFELQRPRPSERDDDGWVHAWIGLRTRLRRTRQTIVNAAAGPSGPGSVEEAFGYALLGIVRLSQAVDDQLAALEADARMPKPVPADRPNVDLQR